MRLSDSDRILDQNDLPHFWNTINRIALTLNLNLEQIAEMMELTPYRLRLLQRYEKEPTVASAMALSKRINVGFESLVLDRIDYKLMAQQYFGDQASLPEKYSTNALSRRRTVIPFLDYIEQYFGWAQRALILRKFQMTEGMFADPNAPISVRFAADLTRYLLDYYRNPAMLEHMGWHSARSARQTPFADELSNSETASEVYERAFIEVVPKYFEKNYHWRLIQLDTEGCVVEGVPSAEIKSDPDAAELLIPGVCMLRTGFLSSLPNHAQLASMRVKKTACVAHGDSACRYHIQLTDLRITA